jgi:small conductance mechanosensitive channel
MNRGRRRASGAQKVIEKAIRDCESVDKSYPIQIFPKAFGSSSMDIEVAWWTEPKPLDIRRSRGKVVAAIKRALDKEGIEIPFPHRTLTFKEPLQACIKNSRSGKSSGQDAETPRPDET